MVKFSWVSATVSYPFTLLDYIELTLIIRGYDFGFIISLLINRPLPSQEDDFLWWLNAFFPNVYDVKHISRVHNRELQGGPTDLADSLGIPHLNLMTPGYHAVLAGLCFFELKKRYFPDGQGKNFR